MSAPVEVIYDEWTRFEEHPCCAVHAIEARVRWRAEVLTFEPVADGTRLTLRIEYDPTGADGALPERVEGVLEGFRSFVTARARARARHAPH